MNSSISYPTTVDTISAFVPVSFFPGLLWDIVFLYCCNPTVQYTVDPGTLKCLDCDPMIKKIIIMFLHIMTRLPIQLKPKLPDKHLYCLWCTLIFSSVAYFIKKELAAGGLVSLFHGPLMDIELQFEKHSHRLFSISSKSSFVMAVYATK